MNYKVGDKVWIREDIQKGKLPDSTCWYQINPGESDIRGKLVTITSFHHNDTDNYNCKEYKNFPNLIIDHEKTSRAIEPSYEIY